jgi:hypothetical protein
MSLGCWRDVRWEAYSYLDEYVLSTTYQGANIMKKSLIWITAGIATVGFAVPAFASHGDSPSDITPAQVTVATTATTNSVDDTATTNSVDDTATTNSVDDSVTTNSVDDDATTNSIDDDATTDSVEDISGPCDEAEHATDPRCTGVAGTSTDDSGHDANEDNSGHGSENSGQGSDDSGHGSDDSGHGGSDD